MKYRTCLAVVGFLLSASLGVAQTTLGLISGTVVDSGTGAAVSGVHVTYRSLETHTVGTVPASPGGFFILPLLPPGYYQVRVEADRYQAQELQELELAVAAFLEIDFRLRPLSDVWEQGEYRSVFFPESRAVVTFFGPDVDSTHSTWVATSPTRGGRLESSMSQVIDPAQVEKLPLAGRDIYTMLVTQPVVSADSGTARGLGLSANGMRPSSSSFLLDGLENNDEVSTGPLIALPPEAVQEYRISTNNYSAEYGRTAGYLANAVTRSGGSAWHGLGYLYWKNEALNANDFQHNARDVPRTPLKETHLGLSVGGPLRGQSLFGSGSYEHFSSHSQGETVSVTVPTQLFVQSLPAGSSARKLLEEFSPPQIGAGDGLTTTELISPPDTSGRTLGMSRLDYLTPGGAHRLMGRLMLASSEHQHATAWSPYKDFILTFHHQTIGLAFSAISSLRSNLTNEARLGWSYDNLYWKRPHSEIPALALSDGTVLPGSRFNYSYQNRHDYWEFTDNLLWAKGRHVIKVGGSLLLRKISGYLDYSAPDFAYQDLASFAAGNPFTMDATVSQRDFPSLAIPDFNRDYRNRQASFFAEDSFKLSASLVLNFGIRYENFGAPVNVGATKDGLVQLGPGSSLPERITTARVVFPSSGDQQLYDSDGNNWAGRFGFTQNLSENGRTLLRGAYGIFYDRPFDNLWQNLRSNNLSLGFFKNPTGPINFLDSPSALFAKFQTSSFDPGYFIDVLYQPKLRDAYVQSYFIGAQQRVSEAVQVDLNISGSVAHKLLTTDRVNRQFSLPLFDTDFATNPSARFNGSLPDLAYRANQGNSSYNALSLTASYRTNRGQLHLSYTWSHSIDIQSDPLLGDFRSLATVVGGGSALAQTGLAAFPRQFDSGADRGNSDYDQRHNFVIYSFWDLPAAFSGTRFAALFRNWSVSEQAAFRSGLPYSVTVPDTFSFDGGGITRNNRANLLDPSLVQPGVGSIVGGESLLNPAAFQSPTAGVVGNSGRNAFAGPGFFNIDLGVGRTFGAPWLGEQKRITLRADIFNLLNHANLSNPNSLLLSDTFGSALYGRKGKDAGFPASQPFQESARQIQLMLSFNF